MMQGGNSSTEHYGLLNQGTQILNQLGNNATQSASDVASCTQVLLGAAKDTQVYIGKTGHEISDRLSEQSLYLGNLHKDTQTDVNKVGCDIQKTVAEYGTQGIVASGNVARDVLSSQNDIQKNILNSQYQLHDNAAKDAGNIRADIALTNALRAKDFSEVNQSISQNAQAILREGCENKYAAGQNSKDEIAAGAQNTQAVLAGGAALRTEMNSNNIAQLLNTNQTYSNIKDTLCDNKYWVEKEIHHNRRDQERSAWAIEKSLDRVGDKVTYTHSDLTKQNCDLSRQIDQNQFAILKGQSDIEKHASEVAAAAQREIFLNRFEMEKVKNSIEIQAANNFSTLRYENAQQTTALASKLAECCCEIKEKVGATAAATQLLVSQNDANRIRDDCAVQAQENLFLRLNQARCGNGNGGH